MVNVLGIVIRANFYWHTSHSSSFIRNSTGFATAIETKLIKTRNTYRDSFADNLKITLNSFF